MANAYAAGASGLPFAVFRGYAGVDLASINPAIRTIKCPFTGERLAAVPAIRPDVAIIHAQDLHALRPPLANRVGPVGGALWLPPEQAVDAEDANSGRGWGRERAGQYV